MSEAMEVDPPAPPKAGESAPPAATPQQDSEEEDVSDLVELLESADEDAGLAPEARIPVLASILADPAGRTGPKATSVKERAVYGLARAYCGAGRDKDVVGLLTGDVCRPFFDSVTKAKCAKVVRAVLDIVCALAPEQLEMQSEICRNIIKWCKAEKRTFLRQRVDAKLSFILYEQEKYGEALALVDALLVELKKLDDKQLLVETHLVESKIHHGLRGLAKAKAALTASRTCANAIYVAPTLQATIDSMSGILHTEEGDYNTAHSYFLEAFEQLDQLDDREKAVRALKYMMLCRILDSLTKALKISAMGGVGARSDRSDVDLSGLLTGRQGVKYAGKDIEAMSAIGAAASRRSLKEFEEVTASFSDELQEDVLIKHHLGVLHEQLLESNLIRIIEPYSCVEISHVAELIEMPLPVVEKKLSQMILDGKFQGILDQGKGQLIVYEEGEKDTAMEKSLQIIANMDDVASALFERSRALRTMMV
jgi:26S proteasome regulatory subunit N6